MSDKTDANSNINNKAKSNNIIEQEDYEKTTNADIKDWEQWQAFADYFISEMYKDGIVKNLDAEKLKKWMSNPERFKENLANTTAYEYISNPSIFQLFDMLESLPQLKEQITTDERNDNYNKNKKKCKKTLKKIKHKQLTRDILKQTATEGTLCGVWCGKKDNPYMYVFDDLKYVFPAYPSPENNTWFVWLDMMWFSTMNELQRTIVINSLYPNVTHEDYQDYLNNPSEYRFIQFSPERSVCLRTHTLYRNQRFGIPWSTPMLFDVLHKDKLKNLERSVSNRVINSVAVLTLGSEKNEQYMDAKIKKKKAKVYSGVQKALKKNSKGGVSKVIGIPHWSKLDFPEIKVDGLEPDKFKTANSDLNIASGGMLGIVSGDLNFASGKLALDIMYRKIAVLLEQIENEVYQKLFNWILPKSDEDNFSLIYDKKAPLSTKEKLDALSKLNSNYGFSLKAVIDCIDDVDYEQYIADTFREQEELKLPEKLKPYQSSHTTNDNLNKKPTNENPDNDNTDINKSNGGNENPKPSTND